MNSARADRRQKIMKEEFQQLFPTEKPEKEAFVMKGNNFLTEIKEGKNKERRRIGKFGKEKAVVTDLRKAFQMEMAWYNRMI